MHPGRELFGGSLAGIRKSEGGWIDPAQTLLSGGCTTHNLAKQNGLRDVNKQRKKALKQAARQAERQAALELLPANPRTLSELFHFLDRQLPSHPCQHDLSLTREWCRVNDLDETSVVAWTMANGGFCDCEVLANVEERFEDVLKV